MRVNTVRPVGTIIITVDESLGEATIAEQRGLNEGSGATVTLFSAQAKVQIADNLLANALREFSTLSEVEQDWRGVDSGPGLIQEVECKDWERLDERSRSDGLHDRNSSHVVLVSLHGLGNPTSRADYVRLGHFERWSHDEDRVGALAAHTGVARLLVENSHVFDCGVWMRECGDAEKLRGEWWLAGSGGV